MLVLETAITGQSIYIINSYLFLNISLPISNITILRKFTASSKWLVLQKLLCNQTDLSVWAHGARQPVFTVVYFLSEISHHGTWLKIYLRYFLDISSFVAAIQLFVVHESSFKKINHYYY